MGMYNSQYESYYSRLVSGNRSRGIYKPGYPYRNNSRASAGGITKEYIIKRLMFELIGVLCLFSIIIFCKLIMTPQTEAVYVYSKAVLDKTIDYNELLQNIKSIDIIEVENRIEDFIDEMKSKITGKPSLKERVRESFELPVIGEVIENHSYLNRSEGSATRSRPGVLIRVALDSEIKACFEGQVKAVGEDQSFGKYILINHGSGIETRYSYLNNITVTEGQIVEKGQVIGTSGNYKEMGEGILHFQLVYMGQPKDPKEYMSFESI
jgi:murein DD-endopeptidase MepM/ murein hydrolase activator NlpD